MTEDELRDLEEQLDDPTEEETGDELAELAGDGPGEEAEDVEEEEDGGTESSGIRDLGRGILSRIPRPKVLGESGPSEKPKREPKKRAVRLQTLTYDEDADEYTLTDEATYFEDLPPDAVHITGKTNRYFRDLVEDPAYSDPEGIRATDLYLWMVNNSINDALAVKNKTLKDVDIRRYIVIGVGAIIGVCVIYAMF